MPFSGEQAGHDYIFRPGSRVFYKRLGAASLDADDSQFCGAAVPGEDWGEIESLRMCPTASQLRCGKTKRTIVCRLHHAPMIANRLATYLQFVSKIFFLCVLDSGQLIILSLKLSCNLSDFMCFSVNSLVEVQNLIVVRYTTLFRKLRNEFVLIIYLNDHYILGPC